MRKLLNRKIMVVGSPADDNEIYTGGTLLKRDDGAVSTGIEFRAAHLPSGFEQLFREGGRANRPRSGVKARRLVSER